MNPSYAFSPVPIRPAALPFPPMVLPGLPPNYFTSALFAQFGQLPLHPFSAINNNNGIKPLLPLPSNAQCIFCGRFYANPAELLSHLQKHASESTTRRIQKASSPKPASSRSSPSQCQCHICGKNFSRHWLLQGHIRTHTGEKPFQCSACPKAFADKSNLRAHIQTHSGIKPYVCNRCGKRFALKSYLSKHEESTCIRSIAKTSRPLL